MNPAERKPYVLAPCLACGADIGGRSPWWSGAVGPFCTQSCREKNEDRSVWERANAYASRVGVHKYSEAHNSEASGLEESDVARAFVIGYAAGLEAGHTAVGRRTVKK
jgi:hypothetical protein